MGVPHPRACIPLVACLVLAGCGGEQATVTETETETETITETLTETVEARPQRDGAALAQECGNPEVGYSVRYPEGWHTNDGSVAPACSFFHPEPFEVPANTDAISMAILFSLETVAFERLRGGDPAIRILSSEETEVAGGRAVRRETEATGEGLFDAGTRACQYVVDLGPQTLVASTYDVEGLDYERNCTVLDRMVQSFRIK